MTSRKSSRVVMQNMRAAQSDSTSVLVEGKVESMAMLDTGSRVTTASADIVPHLRDVGMLPSQVCGPC